jgi:hypothetical protein
MSDEQWTTMEYCGRCRDYHEVNEEMGSWVCPNKGERPRIDLDKILNDPELKRLAKELK